MTPDIIIEPYAAYAARGLLRSSHINAGRRSMKHLKQKRDGASDDTDSKRVGRALHTLTLEPDTWQRAVVVAEVKSGRVQWAQAEQDHPGLTVISPDEYAKVVGMRDAVRRHPLALIILNAPGIVEASIVWTDAETGVDCMARTDRVAGCGEPFAATVVADLKSTKDARERSFCGSVMEYGYHVQAAHGLAGLNAYDAHKGLPPRERRSVLIAVETEPPHGVLVYELADSMLAEGERVRRRILKQYAECLKADVWPGYNESLNPLEAPAWAKGE
jgi:exodeoxyribonuclease VIII